LFVQRRVCQRCGRGPKSVNSRCQCLAAHNSAVFRCAREPCRQGRRNRRQASGSTRRTSEVSLNRVWSRTLAIPASVRSSRLFSQYLPFPSATKSRNACGTLTRDTAGDRRLQPPTAAAIMSRRSLPAVRLRSHLVSGRATARPRRSLGKGGKPKAKVGLKRSTSGRETRPT
jgi:hypothetical protein